MRSVLCCCKTSGLLHLPSQNLKSLYRRLNWVQSHVISRYLNNTLPSQCSVIINDWPYMPRVVKGDEEPLIAQAQLKSQPAGHILLMTFFNRKKQRKWVLQLNRKKKVLYIIQSNLNIIIRERASQWAQCKESACQCKRCKGHGFHPWIRKIPWRKKWQPTPVFLPGKFHKQRSLAGYSPWKHRVRSSWACIRD